MKHTTATQTPFRSFWMAGYECTDQQNAFGNRVDFINLTGHLERLDKDYEDLSLLNIKTVREGIRWSFVEKKPYEYDWSTVAAMIETGRRKGIQQVWDICHFGFPDDLTPLHPMFPRRFAALCRAFVKYYRTLQPAETLIVTPINEVSFISWLGGDARGTSPYCNRQGWEVKYALMKAYIEGIEAMKEEDPTVRVMTTEPLVNMVPPLKASFKDKEFARMAHDNQFQSVDILAGRICPELRGKPEYLDILGFNYYYNNQWVAGTTDFLPWLNDFSDPRWQPLSRLLQGAYERYGRPIVLSETSHPGSDRPRWIEFIAQQCIAVLQNDIPLLGVCWYPIIDRPDWDHLTPWHHAGVWDADLGDVNAGIPSRQLHLPTSTAFLEAQKMLAEANTMEMM